MKKKGGCQVKKKRWRSPFRIKLQEWRSATPWIKRGRGWRRVEQRGLKRKWCSSPRPHSNLSPEAEGAAPDEVLDHTYLPKWEAKKSWWKFPLKFPGNRFRYRNTLPATYRKQEKPLTASRPGNTRRHPSSLSAFPGGHSWVFSPGFTNEAMLSGEMLTEFF